MPRFSGFAMLVLAFALATASTSAEDSRSSTLEGPPPHAGSRPTPGSWKRIPPHFEPEACGAAGRAFLARTPAGTFRITASSAALLPSPAAGGNPVVMRVRGSSDRAALVPRIPLRGRSHYFRGRDPGRWRRNVPHWGEVRQEEVLPGISLRWTAGQGGGLRYDVLVAPGVDPGALVLECEGATGLRLSPGGDLVMPVKGGSLRHGRPVLYQERDGARMPVEGGFRVLGPSSFGFRAGPRDPALPLVIDPEITTSSYFGGSGADSIHALAVAPDGRLVFVGSTGSTDFPLPSGSSGAPPGNGDAFISVLSPEGDELLATAFVGGDAGDGARGVAVDPDGRVLVCGLTYSEDFPLATPVQQYLLGHHNAFALRLSEDVADLQWSTYLGGNDWDEATGIAAASDGRAFVVGITNSSNFPEEARIQGMFRGGGRDSFLAEFSASGDELVHSTVFGGSYKDDALAVAVDSEDRAVIAGWTESGDFPVVGAFQPQRKGPEDGFLCRISAFGNAVSLSTYVGGLSDDAATAVAVGPGDDLFVTGWTLSDLQFPLLDPFQAGYGGQTDAFLLRLGSDGTPVYSSYLGGAMPDRATGIAVTGGGIAFVTGETMSSDFPEVGPVQQGRGGGIYDGFVAAVDAEGGSLLLSGYLGGEKNEILSSIGVSPAGRVVIAGWTLFAAWPVLSPLQEFPNTEAEGVFAVIETMPPPPGEVTATAVSSARVDVGWTHLSEDVTEVAMERKTGPAEWTLLETFPASTTYYRDEHVVGNMVYRYRFRNTSPFGPSAWSEEAVVLTPPGPPGVPFPPSGFTAELEDGRTARLSWVDRSDSEDFFEILRAVPDGGGGFATLATPPPGTTTFLDAGLQPDRTYTWAVRAGNSGGFSATAGTASLTMPPTAEVTVLDARIKDSPKTGGDSVLLEVHLAAGVGFAGEGIDPRATGLAVRLGGWEGDPLLALPPGADGWKVGRKSSTWKSPRGESPRVRVRVREGSPIVEFRLQRGTLTVAPSENLRIAVGIGPDAGTGETILLPSGKWTWKVP